MKFAALACLSAAIVFASACHAVPEPPVELPAAEETAIVPPAPMVMPKVGGACAYETTVISAPVTAVYETSVQLADADARSFSLPVTAFETPPAVGDNVHVTKRKITKGTCQPLIYAFAGPSVPLTEDVPATGAD